MGVRVVLGGHLLLFSGAAELLLFLFEEIDPLHDQRVRLVDTPVLFQQPFAFPHQLFLAQASR